MTQSKNLFSLLFLKTVKLQENFPEENVCFIYLSAPINIQRLTLEIRAKHVYS
jgi:hypothetical protein